MLARSDRRKARRMASAGVLAAALAVGACTPLDNFLASIPIFSFMRDSPALGPWEAPRPAPPGAVPFASPAVELLPEHGASEAELLAAAAALENPYPMTEDVIARGQIVYQRHCAVCHGPQGLGDGSMIPRFPFAPDLTLDAAVQRSDGYLYAITRAGRGLMAPYGDRINHRERWYVVNYVRYLQQQAGAGTGTGTD